MSTSSQASSPPAGLPGALSAFSYLVADKAVTYRAILGLFTEARQRFQPSLRPAEVHSALREQGFSTLGVEPELSQLVAWKNLSAHTDTAEVSSVEDFYRPRFLYQLSREGEAAEAAVATYEAALSQSGELQSAALDDILGQLRVLCLLGADPSPDPGRVHLELSTLRERFEGLVEQARVFMNGLQRAVDLHGVGTEALLAYKGRLIEYLERFLSQLVLATAEVATLLSELPEERVLRLAEAAAIREVADRLGAGVEARVEAALLWKQRMEGIRAWFLSSRGRPSQSDELRRRTREAIPALLGAIAAHNERRLARTDRVADLRTLARWFSAIEAEAEAHRLWRAAFTLSPARHLSVDEATAQAWDAAGADGSMSWSAAPPMEISPRLRATGRLHRPGKADSVVDRSIDRARLAGLREAEAGLLAAAERQLATGRPFHLSDLSELDSRAFELLLELLGEVLASGGGEVASTDGRFLVLLDRDGTEATMVIDTPNGSFHGPDLRITIHRLGRELA